MLWNCQLIKPWAHGREKTHFKHDTVNTAKRGEVSVVIVVHDKNVLFSRRREAMSFVHSMYMMYTLIKQIALAQVYVNCCIILFINNVYQD